MSKMDFSPKYYQTRSYFENNILPLICSDLSVSCFEKGAFVNDAFSMCQLNYSGIKSILISSQYVCIRFRFFNVYFHRLKPRISFYYFN